MRTGTIQETRFKVIEGGGAGCSGLPDLCPRPAPRRSVAEQAAEMAELFFFGLVQDLHPDQLTDPHAQVRIDRRTSVSLHELLCELRNLPWYGAAAAGRGLTSDVAARRAARLNGDDQLVLRRLAILGLHDDTPTGLSSLVTQDHAVGPGGTIDIPLPGRDAPMSRWLGWCAARSGAGLHLPGQPPTGPTVSRCTDLVRHLQRTPPARIFHNAALAALARGAALSPGLNGWRGGDLFALMAEAERQAIHLSLLQAGRQDRLTRPAVASARLSVALSTGPGTVPGLDAVAEMLNDHTPGLVHWMTLANRARRGPQRTEVSLFLPLCPAGTLPPLPADLALHLTVAAALATLVKAVFDTVPRPVRIAGSRPAEVDLARQADLAVANIALARLVSGGYYPSENLRDMRAGQTIALRLLREVLETDNMPADLGLTDFDGQAVRLRAVDRAGGRGHAMLSVNGEIRRWPQPGGAPHPHLTAVV